MKKLFVLLSGLLIAITSGCSTTDSSKQNGTTVIETNPATPVVIESELQQFDESATIEPVVLYEQDGVKITATGLDYGTNSVDLLVTFENNGDEPLSFVAGSIGYSVNSVNGYMVADGYANVDVEPGKVANEALSYSYDSLRLLGIYQIKQMEVGFEIQDDSYDSVYTGPMVIKTSADDGVITTNGYVDNIQTQGIQNEFGYTIDYINNQDVMEINGVTIQSEVIITNQNGERGLSLEALNTTDEPVDVSLRNVYLNGVCGYDGTWTTTTVNPGKVGVLTMTLDDVVDEVIRSYYGLTNNPSTITMTVATLDQDYDETGPTGELVVTNPTGVDGYDSEGTVVYTNETIDLIYKGMVHDDDIMDSTHLMFLVSNKSGETIDTSMESDSLSINGYMMDLTFGGVKVEPGRVGIMDISVDGDDLSANGISRDSISDIEFTFDATGDDYDLQDQIVNLDLSGE